MDVFFYIWYMAVKEFYGEKIVDKHYHKGEQVYWDKFSSIHNKWFKCSGLVPQAAGDHFLGGCGGVQCTGVMGWAGGRRAIGMGVSMGMSDGHGYGGQMVLQVIPIR